jgi:hypothetical protein
VELSKTKEKKDQTGKNLLHSIECILNNVSEVHKYAKWYKTIEFERLSVICRHEIRRNLAILKYGLNTSQFSSRKVSKSQDDHHWVKKNSVLLCYE